MNKKMSRKSQIIIACIVVVALFLLLRDYFGVKEIGSMFERSGDYKVYYFVNAFEDKNYSKNYRFKAEVERYSESYDDEINGESVRSSESLVRLNKMYFPNGGTVSFDDTIDCNLSFEKKVYCRDDNGKDWYIELTRIKAGDL